MNSEEERSESTLLQPMLTGDKKEGVTGWLFFLAIILTVIYPIRELSAIVGLFRGVGIFESPSVFVVPSYARITILITLLGVFFSIFAGYSLFRGALGTAKWAKLLLLLGLVYKISLLVLPNLWQFDDEDLHQLFVANFYNLCLYAVFFAVWFTYLCVSRRVKNTYSVANDDESDDD